MKFFIYALSLIASIHAVHCAVISSAYEALFFYYAYQIDAAAEAQASAEGVPWTRTLGTKCEGADCSFGTFVKSIISPEAAEALTPTALGDSTSPEIYETAQDIIEHWNYQYTKLVAGSIIEGPKTNWPGMITAIVDKVQAARAVAPSDDLVKRCTTALRWAQAARLTDMIGDVTADPLTGEKTKAFTAEFSGVELKSLTRDLAPDTTGAEERRITFLDLDYEGMADGNSEQLQKFLAWSEMTPTNKFASYKRHRAWAQSYEEKGTELQRGCSA